jgi:WD40 repeat protein
LATVGEDAVTDEVAVLITMPAGTSIVTAESPLAWSHDNQWIAFTSTITDAQRVLTLADVSGENPHPVFVTRPADESGQPAYYKQVKHVDWAPQENILLFDASTDDGSAIYLGIIDETNASMQVKRLSALDDMAYHSPVWSSDMEQFLVLSDEGVKVITGETLETAQSFDEVQGATCARWHPDGEHITFLDENNHMIIAQAATGEHQVLEVPGSDTEQPQPLQPVACTAYAWSPAGDYLAYIQEPEHLKVVGLDEQMNPTGASQSITKKAQPPYVFWQHTFTE